MGEESLSAAPERGPKQSIPKRVEQIVFIENDPTKQHCPKQCSNRT